VSHNSIDVQWMHPERCVSTHRSRAGKTQTIDLERADGRTKDHAVFSPGDAASSMTIENLRPALWSWAPVAIKSTRKDKLSKRGELTRTAEKAKSNDHVVFSAGNAASSWSKPIPVLFRV